MSTESNFDVSVDYDTLVDGISSIININSGCSSLVSALSSVDVSILDTGYLLYAAINTVQGIMNGPIATILGRVTDVETLFQLFQSEEFFAAYMTENGEIDLERFVTDMLKLVSTQQSCFDMVEMYDEILDRYSVMLKDYAKKFGYDSEEYLNLFQATGAIKALRNYTKDYGFFMYGQYEDFAELSQGGRIARYENGKFYDINGNLLTDVGDIEAAVYLSSIGKGNFASGDYADIYKYLTDDEKKVVNYLINTGRFDQLEEYFDFKEDYANQRQGQEKAQEIIDKINSYYANADTAIERGIAYARTLALLAVEGLGDGIGNFFDGLANLFTADGVVSADQYKTSFLVQALKERFDESTLTGMIATGTYEITSSIGNMLPSIALSILGTFVGLPHLGLITMGLSSVGNAREQGLQSGMTNGQAWFYGILTGASEVALSYILGGIPGLSNLEKFAKIPGFKGFIAKLASEGLEESVQSILEPIFNAAVTGTPVDIDWGEVLKSGIYGMITAGAMNGGQVVIGNVTYSLGLMSNDFVADLAKKYETQDLTDPEILEQLKNDLAEYGVELNEVSGTEQNTATDATTQNRTIDDSEVNTDSNIEQDTSLEQLATGVDSSSTSSEVIDGSDMSTAITEVEVSDKNGNKLIINKNEHSVQVIKAAATPTNNVNSTVQSGSKSNSGIISSPASSNSTPAASGSTSSSSSLDAASAGAYVAMAGLGTTNLGAAIATLGTNTDTSIDSNSKGKTYSDERIVIKDDSKQKYETLDPKRNYREVSQDVLIEQLGNEQIAVEDNSRQMYETLDTNRVASEIFPGDTNQFGDSSSSNVIEVLRSVEDAVAAAIRNNQKFVILPSSLKSNISSLSISQYTELIGAITKADSQVIQLILRNANKANFDSAVRQLLSRSDANSIFSNTSSAFLFHFLDTYSGDLNIMKSFMDALNSKDSAAALKIWSNMFNNDTLLSIMSNSKIGNLTNRGGLKYSDNLPRDIKNKIFQSINQRVDVAFGKLNESGQYGIDQGVMQKNVKYYVKGKLNFDSISLTNFILSQRSGWTYVDASNLANRIVTVGSKLRLSDMQLITKYLAKTYRYSAQQILSIQSDYFSRVNSHEYNRMLSKLVAAGTDVVTAARILDCINTTGVCSYTDIANLIVDKYKDNPSAFRKDFGFDLFVEVDGKKVINEIELLVDMYTYINSDIAGGALFKYNNGRYSIADATSFEIDTKKQQYLSNSNHRTDIINKYLQSKNPNMFIKSDGFRCYAGNSISISEMKSKVVNALIDGKQISLVFEATKNRSFNLYKGGKLSVSTNSSGWQTANGGYSAHAVYVTGITDTELIVSSWGERYTIPLSDFADNSYGISIAEITTDTMSSSLVSDIVSEINRSIQNARTNGKGSCDISNAVVSKIKTLNSMQLSELLQGVENNYNLKKFIIETANKNVINDAIRDIYSNSDSRYILSDTAFVKMLQSYVSSDTYANLIDNIIRNNPNEIALVVNLDSQGLINLLTKYSNNTYMSELIFDNLNAEQYGMLFKQYYEGTISGIQFSNLLDNVFLRNLPSDKMQEVLSGIYNYSNNQAAIDFANSYYSSSTNLFSLINNDLRYGNVISDSTRQLIRNSSVSAIIQVIEATRSFNNDYFVLQNIFSSLPEQKLLEVFKQSTDIESIISALDYSQIHSLAVNFYNSPDVYSKIVIACVKSDFAKYGGISNLTRGFINQATSTSVENIINSLIMSNANSSVMSAVINSLSNVESAFKLFVDTDYLDVFISALDYSQVHSLAVTNYYTPDVYSKIVLACIKSDLSTRGQIMNMTQQYIKQATKEASLELINKLFETNADSKIFKYVIDNMTDGNIVSVYNSLDSKYANEFRSFVSNGSHLETNIVEKFIKDPEHYTHQLKYDEIIRVFDTLYKSSEYTSLNALYKSLQVIDLQTATQLYRDGKLANYLSVFTDSQFSALENYLRGKNNSIADIFTKVRKPRSYNQNVVREQSAVRDQNVSSFNSLNYSQKMQYMDNLMKNNDRASLYKVLAGIDLQTATKLYNDGKLQTYIRSIGEANLSQMLRNLRANNNTQLADLFYNAKGQNQVIQSNSAGNNSIPSKSAGNNNFVALSDFHGYDYPLEKIKNYYLREYDVVYILGDATDRGKFKDGTGGIKLLLDIMDLAKMYPDRIKYIPGNHDEFLVGYIVDKNTYERGLLQNGGVGTIRELEQLRRNDPRRYSELVNWLSNLPIQATHNYNGKNYVFAHALFNQRLYNQKPNYSLNDYFRDYGSSYEMAKNVLWFRKKGGSYNPSEMPNSDSIMVIGHTPEHYRNNTSLDVSDPYGRKVKVHCVDGGIAYNGSMLKYDGGSDVYRTEMLSHNNTSPKNSSNYGFGARKFGISDAMFSEEAIGPTYSNNSIYANQNDQLLQNPEVYRSNMTVEEKGQIYSKVNAIKDEHFLSMHYESNDYGVDQALTQSRPMFKVNKYWLSNNFDSFVHYIENTYGISYHEAKKIAFNLTGVYSDSMISLDDYNVVVSFLTREGYTTSQVLNILNNSFDLVSGSNYYRVYNKMVSKGIPADTSIKILDCINSTGVCSYAAVANAIISSYVEKFGVANFEKDFGFSLYVENDGRMEINAIELLVDLYTYVNSDICGGSLFKYNDGKLSLVDSSIDTKKQVSIGGIDNLGNDYFNGHYINQYLMSKNPNLSFQYTSKYYSQDDASSLNVEDLKSLVLNAILDGKQVGLGIYKTPNNVVTFRNSNGMINQSTKTWYEGSGHDVFITGITDDGTGFIVSSLGERCIIPIEEFVNQKFDIWVCDILGDGASLDYSDPNPGAGSDSTNSSDVHFGGISKESISTLDIQYNAILDSIVEHFGEKTAKSLLGLYSNKGILSQQLKQYESELNNISKDYIKEYLKERKNTVKAISSDPTIEYNKTLDEIMTKLGENSAKKVLGLYSNRGILSAMLKQYEGALQSIPSDYIKSYLKNGKASSSSTGTVVNPKVYDQILDKFINEFGNELGKSRLVLFLGKGVADVIPKNYRKQIQSIPPEHLQKYLASKYAVNIEPSQLLNMDSSDYRLIGSFIKFNNDLDSSFNQMSKFFGDAGSYVNEMLQKGKTTTEILELLTGEDKVNFENFLANTKQGRWLSNLSSFDVKLLKDYSTVIAKRINTELRQNKGNFIKIKKFLVDDFTGIDVVEILDQAIKDYGGLESDMVLYRAVNVESFFKQNTDLRLFFEGLSQIGLQDDLAVVTKALKSFVGMEISDYGYMSTSPGYNYSFASHANKYPIVMQIMAPKGTPGAYINQISGFYNKEFEILLARGLKLIIEDVQFVYDCNGNKKVFVKCRVKD